MTTEQTLNEQKYVTQNNRLTQADKEWDDFDLIDEM